MEKLLCVWVMLAALPRLSTAPFHDAGALWEKGCPHSALKIREASWSASSATRAISSFRVLRVE